MIAFPLLFRPIYVLSSLGAEPVLPVTGVSVSGPISGGRVIYQGTRHSAGGLAAAGGEKPTSDCHWAAGSARWCQSHGINSARCSGNSPSVFHVEFSLASMINLPCMLPSHFNVTSGTWTLWHGFRYQTCWLECFRKLVCFSRHAVLQRQILL